MLVPGEVPSTPGEYLTSPSAITIPSPCPSPCPGAIVACGVEVGTKEEGGEEEEEEEEEELRG